MDHKNLASRLCYLPIYIVERVQLWLTLKGIKPASIISINSRAFPLTPSKYSRIKHWINDAGLYCLLDPNDPRKSCLIVSKDPRAIEELSKMEPPSYDKDQRKDTYKMGILFGYPPKAVKTFAYGQRWELADPTGINSPIKNWPESLYAEFFVRKGHEKEDIKIAKKWMATIRKDIPKLAMWFEKEVANVVEN